MTQYQDRQRKLSRSAKLTEQDVLIIKRRLGHFAPPGTAKREWPRDLAREYNVGTETIRRIDRGDNWGWLIPESPEVTQARQLSEADLQERAAASLKVLQEKLKEGT